MTDDSERSLRRIAGALERLADVAEREHPHLMSNREMAEVLRPATTYRDEPGATPLERSL